MELSGPPYLIDGHVHLHPSFDEERFFTAATDNFEVACRVLGLSPGPRGILMLTESSGTNRFAELRLRASNQEDSGLEIEATSEDQSLFVAVPGGSPVLVIAGRQVVAAEDLEVLALGCVEELPDGQPLAATLDHVREVRAIPVIPWGFGKWHSARRRILLEVLQQRSPGSFFLGDNGGRASLLPRSSIFRAAAEKGVWNLPGSDPLPFQREEQRVGSFGFVLNSPLDLRRPAEGILRRLSHSATPLQGYGSGIDAHSFFLNQVGMQIRKQRRGKR